MANPTAMLLAAVKMLEHINHPEHANQIKSAVEQVLAEKKVRTRDLGGFATTRQFTQAVIDASGTTA